MFKLPKNLRDKEILFQRLILFAMLLGGIVLYFREILEIISTAIWICLPFIIGGIIAFVLNTLCRVLIRYARRIHPFKLTNRVETGFKVLSLVIVAIALFFVFASIVPQLITSVERFLTNAPKVITQLYAELLEWAKQYPALFSWLIENEDAFLNSSDWVSSLFDYITLGGIGEAFKSIGLAVTGTFSYLWIVFISFMFSFIAFFNTRKFLNECKLVTKAYLPTNYYKKLCYISRKTSRVFSQYLGGTLLECVILATLVTLINSFLNIPYPLLIGFICGIGALIPMFGATIAAVLCAIFLALVNPFKGLEFIVSFLLLQQVEGNFIYPNVVGKTVGLPSMFVLMAITIGASIAGILGIVLSIPITTVCYELINEDAIDRIKKKEKEPDECQE